MVTSPTFPLIHTFCDLREEAPTPVSSAATSQFVISPAGEISLTEFGWHQREIERIKVIFQVRQEQIMHHFETSTSPFIWEDVYRSSVYFVFPKNDIIVLSRVPIGKGSFKTVFPVIDLVAGKILTGYSFQRIFGPLPLQSDYEPYREIAVLESHRGMKNLLSLERTISYRIPDSKGMVNTLVLSPLYNAGSLSKAMRFSSLDTRRCSAALQMIRGLMTIHAHVAIHGDLKPENIYLEVDIEGKLNLVIGDYGSYAHLSDASWRRNHNTTVWYCSPDYLVALDAMEDFTSAMAEVDYLKDKISRGIPVHHKHLARADADFLRSQSIYEEKQERANDHPLDVWSLGVIFYQLFSGELPPWIENAEDSTSALSILKYMDQITFKPLPGGQVPLVDVPPTEPPEMQRLIQRMLVPKDAHRITIHQVYEEFIEILRA
ncbi:MAG: hypothetical protein NTX49_06850 [Chlamydiae bacterium]|nr:hypothetical protein [Chlamydiota bacterium]